MLIVLFTSVYLKHKQTGPASTHLLPTKEVSVSFRKILAVSISATDHTESLRQPLWFLLVCLNIHETH